MAEKDSNSSLLHELLLLQKESNERDSRIEGKMDTIDTRMKYIEAHSLKQDQQLDKLTELLSDQKIQAKSIEANTIKICEHETRITNIENAAGKAALTLWKKLFGIVFTGLLTALIGFFIGRL